MSGYELVEVHDPHRDRGRILNPVRGFGVKCPMSETLTLTINKQILLDFCYTHTLPSPTSIYCKSSYVRYHDDINLVYHDSCYDGNGRGLSLNE